MTVPLSVMEGSGKFVEESILHLHIMCGTTALLSLMKPYHHKIYSFSL